MMSNKISSADFMKIGDIDRRICLYFFSFPDKVTSLSDLAKLTGSSKTSAKIAVTKLLKSGILTKEEYGKAWSISLNKRSSLATARKISFNLNLVYETDIIGCVYRKFPNARAIIIFGSYRWGTDNEKSDIDIAIEVAGERKIRIEELGIIEKLSYRKDVKVNAHVFSRGFVDKNLFANIANGIVLDGFLEVKP